MAGKSTDWIERLVAEQRTGYSLDRAFYRDPEIFEQDLQRAVFPFWLFVGHVARIPDSGDFFLAEIAGESIIMTRDHDDRIHALANVCRHRGSRVCRSHQGHAKRLVCPYHAWTYASDGQLLAAREMDPQFDKSQFGLRTFPVQSIEGLMFINLSQQPEPFDEVIREGTEYLKPHGLKSAKIADRRVWQVEANWKLVMENFRECYHCPPAHPE
ncbi:MAG: aromatic ring-hydroxylating dioxygenase subunit alpha, partial [Planctomycetaceae bacterium]